MYVRALVLTVAVAVVLMAPSAMAEVLLLADFDDLPIDEPVGTSGAAAGEPVSVDPAITAIVRGTPLATPALEIRDNDDFSAGYARFQLLGDVEVSAGLLAIDADLYFVEFEGYTIAVREAFSSASSFANVDFSEWGDVSLSDAAGALGPVGDYETGRVTRLRLLFDLDAGTYDVFLDGQVVVAGRAHGVTGTGIGAVLVGTIHDPDLAGTFLVDDLRVATVETGCLTSATALCLSGERFLVTADYRTGDGTSGAAQAVALTADSGYFWFFGQDNLEVVVKVLDGCAVNQRYWVFAAGMTNVEVSLRVEDTATGQLFAHSTSLGEPFAPLQATAAFATCP